MANAKAELYSYIQNVKQQCPNLKKMSDVGAFCIENNIDLKLHMFDSNGVCGFACIGQKQDTIVLNTRRNEIERFFDFIHELVHTKKHRNEKNSEFMCFAQKQNSFLEWEANEGAAEFLAPYKLFIPAFSDLYELYIENYSTWRILYGSATVPQVLANKFGISEMVAIHRIENLSYEIEQYRSYGTIEGIIIRSKQSQNKMNIVSKNYIKELKLEEAKHNFELPWGGAIGVMGF